MRELPSLLRPTPQVESMYEEAPRPPVTAPARYGARPQDAERLSR
jgi:hypothetical protein